jgi:gas vesicle protein
MAYDNHESSLDRYDVYSLGSGFAAGILLGALIGATAMLFYAPQSGKATRKLVRRRARQLSSQVRDTADEALEQARDRAREVRDDVRTRLEDTKHRGQELLDVQRQRVESAVKTGRQALHRK